MPLMTASPTALHPFAPVLGRSPDIRSTPAQLDARVGMSARPGQIYMQRANAKSLASTGDSFGHGGGRLTSSAGHLRTLFRYIIPQADQGFGGPCACKP